MADGTDNVVKVYFANAARDPNTVLEQAIGDFEEVIVIGWDRQGALDARASLGLNHATINWLLDVFKSKLINGDYSDEAPRS